MVSGRTVGIGAYLARLGRRCVQRADQPIILTGFVEVAPLLCLCLCLGDIAAMAVELVRAVGASHPNRPGCAAPASQ